MTNDKCPMNVEARMTKPPQQAGRPWNFVIRASFVIWILSFVIQHTFLFVLVATLFALSACSKKADVKSQVSELEKAFQAATPTASVPAATPTENQNLPADANAFVHVALTAVRANDFAGGVIALQEVQRIPGVSANQLMAVHGTMQAMTADLVARAAKGDPKAKADLAAIEKTRSQ